ncbi:hypothetical protein G6009_00955 [Dietzia sp. SLG510A3-30A2]|nr:hypothetical protein [Dietzia sp. SLG510A3-30A2]
MTAWTRDDLPEEWRQVVGYEGIYEVSNRGRVRSVDREVTSTSGQRYVVPGQSRKITVRKDGRHTVSLCRDGAHVYRNVHKLVAEAFIGPCPEGALVLHFDDDRSNNHVENLRYGTHGDNRFDSVRNGTHAWASKTHCPRNHAYSGANLRVTGGARYCVSCVRARGRVGKNPTLRPHFDDIADSIYRTLSIQEGA